jgi:hypothetical protein
LLGGSSQGGSAARASGAAGSSIYGAGQQAQQMAQFRPVGVTTGFGQSRFGFDPSGQLTSAGYTLDPRLQGIQGRVLSQAEQYRPEDIAAAAQPLMGGAQSLFGLGQQYLAESPQAAAQRYISQQQGLLAPMRAAEEARLATANFGRGTGGLGVQTGTGSAPSNPLAQALFNAQGRQDLELAARADQAAMDRARFGAGLFGTGGELLGQVPRLTTAGYSPLEAQLGLLRTTETMGQQPFLLSQDLADRYARAGAQAGNLYMQPQAAAASAYSKYQGYSPMGSALSSIGSTIGGMGGGGQAGSWFSSLFNSGGGSSPAGAFNNSPGFNNNSGGNYGFGTGGFE